MGILTWQNVPVGDLSAGQEGFRTASMLLDRATNAGQEGIAAYQSILDSKKAFEQQTADKVMAAKMASIQDPEEYKKALAAGLVDPAIAQAASLGSLMQANKQMDVLQGRAQADQQLLNTKQSFDALAYKMGREQEGDRLSDAAMPVFNAALKVAVNDRAKALKMIEDSNVHLEDKLKMAESLRTQYQDRTQERLGWARHAQEQRQFELLKRAAQLEQALVQDASGDSIKQGKLLDAYAKQDPELGPMVVKLVKQNLSATDPTFFKEVGSLGATGGSAPMDVSDSPHAPSISRLKAYTEDLAGRLTPGAKILERSSDPLATASAMAEKIKEDHPDFDTNELTDVINETRERAKDKFGVDIDENVAANMILDSMTKANFIDWDNFAKGADLAKGRVDKLIESYTNDVTKLDNYRQMLMTVKQVTEKQAQRDARQTELSHAKNREAMGRSNPELIKRLEDEIKNLDNAIGEMVPTPEGASQRQIAREDVAKKLEKAAKDAKDKEAKKKAKELEKQREANKKGMRLANKTFKKYGSMFSLPKKEEDD